MATGVVALVVAACGGSPEEAVETAPSAVSDATGSELAGIRFDVRRDPG